MFIQTQINITIHVHLNNYKTDYHYKLISRSATVLIVKSCSHLNNSVYTKTINIIIHLHLKDYTTDYHHRLIPWSATMVIVLQSFKQSWLLILKYKGTLLTYGD